MMNKIIALLQDYIKTLMGFCKGLPLIIAIIVVLAIIIIPDPLIILGSVVIKKIKTIAI